MFRITNVAAKGILACAIAFAFLGPIGGAGAKGRYGVVYSLQGGSDGANPYGSLIADAAGNLYGTTFYGGGTTKTCTYSSGCGTVFRLAPDGAETVLYRFCSRTNCADGANPQGGLMADAAGNLYGTTTDGGGKGCNGGGCGTVFKLASGGEETVLYSFRGGSDGDFPTAGLIADSGGNFYGTTMLGGGSCDCGTVFRLAADGTETVLHAFVGGSDGVEPLAALIMDPGGNVYGTTFAGGGDGCYRSGGCGSVFEVSATGAETVLYSFQGGSDGAYVYAGVTADASGNLYGATAAGGGGKHCTFFYGPGCGTVFRLATDGTETLLYSFPDRNVGELPEGDLIAEKNGNLYGTTAAGGATTQCHRRGCGTVFRLATDGTETMLHAFEGGKKDGLNPDAGLISDGTGNLYGTTTLGGRGRCPGTDRCGTVFEIKE